MSELVVTNNIQNNATAITFDIIIYKVMCAETELLYRCMAVFCVHRWPMHDGREQLPCYLLCVDIIFLLERSIHTSPVRVRRVAIGLRHSYWKSSQLYAQISRVSRW